MRRASTGGRARTDPEVLAGADAARPASVLFVVHSTHLGGGEILAHHTARWLSDHGHPLTIVAPEGPLRPLLAETADVIPSTPLLPIWGASLSRWAKDLLRTALDVPRLRRTIRATGSEVVLTNTSTTLAPVLAARLEGVPVVVHVREWPTSRLATPLVRLHARLATTVVVIAEPLLAAAARRGGRARIVYIHDGIQPATLPPRPPIAPGRRLRLGIVGGFDHRKGQDVAIRALARLRDAHVDAELMLVGREGSPQYMAELQRLIDGLDLAGRVHQLGERRDVPALMGTWDALLAPSRGEWTPLAVMEAMAIGLPVIATSVGAVNELLDRGRCGTLVTPGDVADLADAVAAFAQQAGGAAWLARTAAARQRVLERYDLGPSLERLSEELARAARAERVVMQPA